jgi:hypothetical protein
MQLKLQSCATSYNPGAQYCKKLYNTYMTVWPGHQKMNPKCGEILNQELRKDITVCAKGRKKVSHGNR